MRETLKAIKDSNAISGYSYKRTPRNWKERLLKWRGWEPAGVSLLTHHRYHHGTPKNLDDAWNAELVYLKKIIRIKES